MSRLLAVVAGLLALAGCAGSSGPSSPAPPPSPSTGDRIEEEPRLTQRQLVRRANRICGDTAKSVKRLLSRERRAISNGERTGSRSELLADVLKKTFRTLRSYQRKLRALRPPVADQARWDLFNATRTRSLAAGNAVIRATRDGNAARARRLTRRADRIDRPAGLVAQQLGLRRCAFNKRSFTP